MLGVDAKIDGAARLGEVVKAASASGAEVEDGCSAGRSLGNLDGRGKFVGGVDDSGGGLKPGRDARRAIREIPAEDDGHDAGSGEGAAADVLSDGGRAGLNGHGVGSRGVGLPEGLDVGAELEASAQGAGVENGGQIAASLEAYREEMEVGAVTDAVGVAEEGAELPLAVGYGLEVGGWFGLGYGGCCDSNEWESAKNGYG